MLMANGLSRGPMLVAGDSAVHYRTVGSQYGRVRFAHRHLRFTAVHLRHGKGHPVRGSHAAHTPPGTALKAKAMPAEQRLS